MFEFHSKVGLLTLGVMLLTWGGIFALGHERQPDIHHPISEQTTYIVRTSLLALLIYGTLLYLLNLDIFSRLLSLIYSLVVIVLYSLIALIMKMSLKIMKDPERRLIVLPSHDSGDAHRAYHEITQAGFEVAGAIADGKVSSQIPVLGSIRELESILEQHAFDSVILHPSLPREEVEYCIQECLLRGIPTELLIGHYTLSAPRFEIVHLPYGAAVRMLPHRNDPVGQSFKRLTDIVLSSLALVVLAPFLLAIMVLIKVSSKGPVFFVQKRAGLHGRVFSMIKFRTMVENAEDLKASLLTLNEMNGPTFKMKNDPRVTPIGRFLRKTSLDELPQLWNVWLGHMSLVGPRPPIPSEVSQYEPWQRRRLSVRPGITCIWQISGRNEIDFERWMEMDLEYIDKWNYMQDWVILLKTIPAVLKRRGAS